MRHKTTLTLLAVVALLLLAVPVALATGTPVVYDDWNPAGGAAEECSLIGSFAHAYKVDEPAPNGSWTHDGNTITIYGSDGNVFNWSATSGIGAVIVKAGTGANVWVYDPQSMGDTGLYGYADKTVSHVTFCWNYYVEVTKDAFTSFTRTYDWSISKSVTPATWDLFTGDTGTSSYTVSVTKTGYTDSNFAASGSINIYNPDPTYTAYLASVTDDVGGVPATVNCPSMEVAPGATLTCTYSTGLPDGTNRINTATATATAESKVGGGTGTADVIFGNPTTEVNASITVTDTNGKSWGPVSESATWYYDMTFSCADEGTNPNTATIVETGQQANASVTVACHDLTVTKDAATALTRTYEWDITKSVTPESWDLFTGDSGTSEYTVSVDKTGFTDSDWAVSGNIAVNNPAPIAATINSVTDLVSPDIAATVVCEGISFPYSLAAGGTLNCTYSADLPDAADRLNTATAILQNYARPAMTLLGTQSYDGTANVKFDAPFITEVNASINVTDTNDMSWGPVLDDAVWTYPRTFTCDDDEGAHGNVATIVETGQSDDASVMVNCYALTVTKDADTSFDRTYLWTIDKSADQTDLLLSEGQLFDVNYAVTVDLADPAYTDSNWAVAGAIAVNNPAPIAATINGVSDIISPAIAANVSCGVVFPYSLAVGGTLDCTYNASLPDASDRTNTATATLQNYDYDKDGVGTASGTTDFSGAADVSFANATINEIDECINVSDTNVGVLGQVCVGDAPKTFNYTLSFGAHPDADVLLECGDNTHTNVASFVANDTDTTGSDNWTVNAKVACDTGCTLTPGYWKTHSEYGPAPYDDTWAKLPNGADTPFFGSGLTYYQTLWTPSAGGNAWVILAHAYIAAELNMLNDASAPAEVQDAMIQAESYLSQYGPNDAPKNPARRVMIQLAEILDNYNNGLIGPGHCDE